MKPSPAVVDEILTEYKRTRSPFKAAKATGIDIEIVWQVLDENKDRLGPYQERHGGKGRPELQQFLAARRRASDRGWDNDDPAIMMARKNYEAGTHDMATGRDGAWLLLYSIPRRRPTKPRHRYFTLESN